MKTLTLLRHAKSGMGEPGQRDFDRTLNAKGQQAATAMGRHLRALDLAFDRVIASPAARVVATLEHFGRGFGTLPAIDYDKRAYLAAETTLLELIRGADAAAGHLLVVAHNPGLEDLVLMLVGDAEGGALRDDVEEKFPTASAAVMTFAVAHWSEVAADGATLARFVRPRDLDPRFGPDAP